VNLEFQGDDNTFEMTVVKDLDDDVICLSSDDSHDSVDYEFVESESVENESEENESVGDESEDDDFDMAGYSFGPFRNDGRFGWELKVTSAVASVRKMQVGVKLFCFTL
jgi:hypothetical protein